MNTTRASTMITPVAYADPQAFENFKNRGHEGGVYAREWMWANPDKGLVGLYSAEQVDQIIAAKDEELQAVRADMAELGGHATVFQGDLVRAQARIEQLERALVIAEAALSDIGDADREPGDDLAWCENRAAQALPQVRTTLAAKAPMVSHPQNAPTKEPEPVAAFFLLNHEYPMRGGGKVKLVSIHNPGTDYETMACAEGVHRYTRRPHPLNLGRVTGTDGTDPRDLLSPKKDTDRGVGNPESGLAGGEVQALGFTDGAVDAIQARMTDLGFGVPVRVISEGISAALAIQKKEAGHG